MKEDKKDWVCLEPFTYAEVFRSSTYMCCPQWLPVNLGDPRTIANNWKSQQANDIRESILDGSYKFCNEDVCPKLSELKKGRTAGFIRKEEFLINRKLYDTKLPSHLRYNFDRSCNLKCPSCRLDFIKFEGKDRTNADDLIVTLERQLGASTTMIDCTGSGDPFFSRTFKKWLMTLDKGKYPKLERIHLHTNGTLWNESNWNKMKNVHTLVKSCEISIDAATKHTYENITRLGGKWETLVSNLKFIATLPHLESVRTSFVVQEGNFHEMLLFYELIETIFHNSSKEWKIFYHRINDWGLYTKEKFKELDVADSNHPKFSEFREIFSKLPNNRHVIHNLPTLGSQ